MSLLTIIQEACRSVGVPVPTTIIGNQDQTVQQMLQIANQLGNALLDDHDWQGLTSSLTHTAVAGSDQGSITDIASDLYRFLPQSFYNESLSTRVIGPLGASAWKKREYGTLTIFSRPAYRVRGNVLLIHPESQAGHVYKAEYISANFVQKANGDFCDQFTNDNDKFRLSETLLSLGVVWKFLMAKGFDSSQARSDYLTLKSKLIIQEKGLETASLAQSNNAHINANISDGNFNQ